MSEPRKFVAGVWTWRCGLCKQQPTSTAGSRTIIRAGKKIKICADCAKDLNLPPPVRTR